MTHPSSVTIGNLTVSPATFLAPIAEVTDSPFRLLVRRFGGVGGLFTEMIPSDAYTRDIERTRFMVRHTEAEHPLFFQIVGKDPQRMADAARRSVDDGADAVDINFGCPSSTITRHGSGSALLRDLELAATIIRAVRQAVSCPITIKIRSGWDMTRLVYREMGAIAEAEGVDAVFFHGRTRKQMYRDTVHYDHIADLADRLSIPVIGNGDIVDRETLARMWGTGCAGVMIARGAIKRPWLFAELAGGEPVTPDVMLPLITEQFQAYATAYPPKLALHKMKIFMSWYSRALPGGKALRTALSGLHDCDGVLNLLSEYGKSLAVN